MSCVFYALQHRFTDQKEWVFSSWDVFGKVAEPWIKTGRRPKYLLSHNETHAIWSMTGYHGWQTLAYAARGLKRVRKADANGKFNSFHEFRLVKVTFSMIVEELTAESAPMKFVCIELEDGVVKKVHDCGKDFEFAINFAVDVAKEVGYEYGREDARDILQDMGCLHIGGFSVHIAGVTA